MSDEEIIEIIKNGFSINDVCIKIYGYNNALSNKKIKSFISHHNLDISHFGIGKKNIKHPRINKKCEECHKEFIAKIIHGKEQKFCSKDCSLKHLNSDPEIRKKMAETLKKTLNDPNYKRSIRKSDGTIVKEILNKKRICPECGEEFIYKKKKQKFCSVECVIKYNNRKENKDKINKRLSGLMKEKIKNGEHKGWQSRNIESYPEKFFKQVLENNNILYEFNKPICKRLLGFEDNACFFLDFYLSGTNIDLEIDGKQHRFRKEHDERRDISLTKNGYDVYRIEWRNINTEEGKKYIKNEIDKFIRYYQSKITYLQNKSSHYFI